MDIALFRAIKARLLRNETESVVLEAERRIQLTLDLLDQETMSKEGIALIITQVKSEDKWN